LAQHASLDAMRARASEFAPNSTDGFWRSNEQFFRAGGLGAWREVFTEQEIRPPMRPTGPPRRGAVGSRGQPTLAGHLSWHVVSPPDPRDSEPDTPEQFRIRQDKRARLLGDGVAPYPVAVPVTHTLKQVREAYPDLPTDTATGDTVGVAGRVVFARNSGKLCFATLQEGDGTQLQVMISLASVGQSELDRWKSDVDLGDIAFVHGEVISSRRGELSVLADSWQMAA